MIRYRSSQTIPIIILYLKDPKNSMQKLLDTLNSFSQIAGYKINTQKSVAFYTPTMNWLRKNIRKYNSLKKIKYLGINLTKDVNDLYKENYKPSEERAQRRL
jgi:hypothetical protein